MAVATKSNAGVLSNVDLIRRFVFENSPVSADAIADYVVEHMASARDRATALDRYVLPVLNAQSYYEQQGDGCWRIVREAMPEYRVVGDALREEKRLLYERDVKSRIARKLGMKVISVVCDLAQAPELQRHDSYWGLKEWTVANEQAGEILKNHPGGLSEKDLLKQVCERFKLDPETTVLNLAADRKRFVNDKKNWYLKEHFDKSKQAKPVAAVKLPEIKGSGFDLLLEGNFVLAQTSKAEEKAAARDRTAKSRLKKAQVREAQQVLEQREDLQPKEDLAARMSQVLLEAGVDEYAVKSFQRVEKSGKERGLSQKERDEINDFVDGLLRQETTGVGPNELSVASAPLSARKVLDVLRLKHLAYFRDRAVLPAEYYRLLVRILKPTISDSVLNPAAFEGLLATELFSYLFDTLDGAAWSLTEDGAGLEVVQPDGARYRLGSNDKQLTDQARDKFNISQTDLLDNFVSYRYTGIEGDKTLARAARIITRLSGCEDVYIANRDFFSELPQVFGSEANEENEIAQRFDCVVGNFAFVQDDNLAANYLDLALKLLNAQGHFAGFVTEDLLRLLKQHELLGDFLSGMVVTHFLRLPLIEGRHQIVQLHIQRGGSDELPIITGEIADLKAANALLQSLPTGEEEDGSFKRVEQLGLTGLIS